MPERTEDANVTRSTLHYAVRLQISQVWSCFGIHEQTLNFEEFADDARPNEVTLRNVLRREWRSPSSGLPAKISGSAIARHNAERLDHLGYA
jgi:hypothetical protein